MSSMPELDVPSDFRAGAITQPKTREPTWHGQEPSEAIDQHITNSGTTTTAKPHAGPKLSKAKFHPKKPNTGVAYLPKNSEPNVKPLRGLKVPWRHPLKATPTKSDPESLLHGSPTSHPMKDSLKDRPSMWFNPITLRPAEQPKTAPETTAPSPKLQPVELDIEHLPAQTSGSQDPPTTFSTGAPMATEYIRQHGTDGDTPPILTSSFPPSFERKSRESQDFPSGDIQGLDENLLAQLTGEKEDGENLGLEEEAAEAAFVVCWPTSTSLSKPTFKSLDEFPCIGSSWDGGCVLSVWDSGSADAWIDENYDHKLLVLLRDANIGGPVASMLSIQSAALAIFGPLSMSLIHMADALAELSGLPVIVRPPEEDPCLHFRKQEHSTTPNVDGGLGEGSSSAAQDSGAQKTTTAFSGSTGQPTSNYARGFKRGDSGKQLEGDRESDDEEKTPSRLRLSSPLPPSSSPQETVHSTDITLKVLMDSEDRNDFLRVITKAKFYPLPNLKVQSENTAGKSKVSEPSIEGHVFLETRSSPSIIIDGAAGTVGFLANKHDHLRTEYFMSLGYDEPAVKYKMVNNNQTSQNMTTSIGLGAGKPTAMLGYTTGKLAGSSIEIADDEVAKHWVVSREYRDDNWESPDACYRSLSTKIIRWPPRAYQVLKHCNASDIEAEYGMAVEVAKSVGKENPLISFAYRHQIHCWVALESRAKIRGMIVLTAHYLPDIRTEHPLWISGRPSMNMNHKNTQHGSTAGDTLPKKIENDARLRPDGVGDDCFVFSTATLPKVASRTFLKRFSRRISRILNISSSKKSKGKEQAEQVPVRGLLFQGWNHRDIGWNHTDKRWYHPVWPKLDGDLNASWDGSNVRWKLDWEHEDAAETTRTTSAQTMVLRGLEELGQLKVAGKGKGKQIDE